jgi:hypothetical protein
MRHGTALCWVLLGIMYAAHGDVCDEWQVRVASGSGASARTDAVMRYDQFNDEFVLFGGYFGAPLDDTWTFDGTTWTLETPATMPPARRGAALMLSTTTGTLWMFGGMGTSGVLSDTWSWDGSDWTQLSPTQIPPARHDAAFANRDLSGTFVPLLFGGFDDNGEPLDDTWVGSGSSWVPLFVSTRPTARGDSAMAYQEAFDHFVLFGGLDEDGNVLGDTWLFEYGPLLWRKASPSSAPAPRAQHQMTYDAGRGVVVLHGGTVNGVVLDDTWEFDGYNWKQVPMPPAAGDPDLFDAALAYDVDDSEAILFGGQNLSGFRSATYARVFAPGPTITSQPQQLARDVGEEGFLEVSAAGAGLDYQWRRNGVPISDEFGFVFGANTDRLWLMSVRATDYGYYDVLVDDGTCAVTRSAIVSLVPRSFDPLDHVGASDPYADFPDDLFDDANGDGIDGVRVGPIFVSATFGDDANLGTIEAPMRTLGAALLAAKSRTPVRPVYIAGGAYPETVTLVAGVPIFGGFDDMNGWSRSAAAGDRAVIGGGPVAVWSVGDEGATWIDRVEIRGADNYTSGAHAIGLAALDSTISTDLTNCVVTAGHNLVPGRTGGRGANGPDLPGLNGGNGGPGACDDTIAGGTGGTPGTPGAGALPGFEGGFGGTGGRYEVVKGNDGTFGNRNFVDVTPGGQGGFRCSVGNPGDDGTPGAAGATGATGSGATAFFGVGGTGSTGRPGDGGGGGGGGGGQVNNQPVGSCACILCVGGSGNGGGGGGGGGAGGSGGLGGEPGGASIGIFARNKTVTVVASTITAGDGAPGGNGGAGGLGGLGGAGGSGGSVCLSEVGRGGDGGAGGRGGAGGVGGGGRGGHSLGTFSEFNGTVFLNFSSSATAGAAGPGGGSAPGGAGDPGESASERTLNALVTDLANDGEPTAAYAFLTTTQNTAATPVDALVADRDGDAYTLAIATQPGNGAASVTGNQLAYTPNAEFVGVDSFRFRAEQVVGEEFEIEGTAVVVVAPPTPLAASNDGPVETFATLQLTATDLPGAQYFWSGPLGFVADERAPTRTNFPSGGGGEYVVLAYVNGLWLRATTTVVEIPTPCPGDSTRLYVDANGPGGSCGDSWSDAYATITEALNRAVQTPRVTEIWVAAGTYSPGGGATATFTLIDGVALIGGFGGDESYVHQRDVAAQPTILDGADTNYHVVTCNAGTPTIDGFTIMRGAALEQFGTDAVGAGLLVTGGAPRVLNCRFVDNNSYAGGGAIRILTSGTTPMEIVGCAFENNTADPSQPGGAIRVTGNSRFIVDRCTFSGNSAASGGAIYRPSGQDAWITNSIFVNNTAFGPGGGAAIEAGGRLHIVNCTVALNTTTGSGRGAISSAGQFPDARVYNSIVWENDTPASSNPNDQISDDLTTENSIVSGLFGPDANGNIGDDPEFVSLGFDYRLMPTSPARDSGDNARLTLTGLYSALSLPADVDGGPRIYGGTVDRGAFEYVPTLLSDCDGDGDVDYDDWRGFAGCYSGPDNAYAANCERKDIDGDGDVDIMDFFTLQGCFAGANMVVDAACEAP